MVQAVWIGPGVAVWLTLTVVTALLVGRIVSRRDAQVPAEVRGAVPPIAQQQSAGVPRSSDGVRRP